MLGKRQFTVMAANRQTGMTKGELFAALAQVPDGTYPRMEVKLNGRVLRVKWEE